MRAVGVVEMIVGIAILARWTRLGHMPQPRGWWALLLNLIAMGAFFD